MLEKSKKKFKTIIVILLLIIVPIWIVLIVKSIQDTQEEKARDEDIVFERSLPQDVIEDMIKVGQQQRDIEEKYPWYFDLPIENGLYQILWDWEKEQFRIGLKIDENSPKNTIERYTKEAVINIEELTKGTIQERDYYVIFIE